jgi:hypothetical protein
MSDWTEDTGQPNGPVRWIALIFCFVAGPYLVLVPIAHLTDINDWRGYVLLASALVPAIAATLLMNWSVYKKFVVAVILTAIGLPHAAFAGLLAACSTGNCI